MPAGRPPTYKTAEQLQKKIDEYFSNIESNESIPTITELCLYLGFASRQSFYDNEKVPELSYTIKKARLRVESVYEKRLFSNSPTGAIFALKNFGWSDKQEIEHSGPDGGVIPVAFIPTDKPSNIS